MMTCFLLYGSWPRRLLLISMISIGCLPVFATNYFFAANGKASATGLSPHHAINSVARISALPLKAGDTVFFRRGDVFRGSFVIAASGTEKASLVFAAYGNGAHPVISGSVLLKEWKQVDAGLWSHSIDKSVTELFVNDVRQTLARFPNKGYLRIDSGVNKSRLFNQSLLTNTIPYTGATIRMRTIDWVYEMRRVANSRNGWLDLGFHPHYTDGPGMHVRSSNSTTTIYNLTKGYGFYLDGLPQFIDSAGEWAMRENQLLLKTLNDLRKQTVEGTTHESGIILKNGVKYVLIKDLSLTHFFHYGIKGGEGLRNITIQNCVLSNIHTTAIGIDSGSVHTTIRQCNISDVAGKGIALLEAERALIEDCTVRRIGLMPGYGYTGVNGGTAIGITNIETKIYKKEKYSNNNVVRWNVVDSCGYNGIRVDGSYNLVNQNRISHCGLTLNDGSALYCFAAQPGITHHSVFRNNIVLHSKGNIEGTPANAIHFNGIYIDNNSHDMVVEGNTSAYHSSAGIVNNDASFQNTFRNNVVFDTHAGLGFAEWANKGKVYACTSENNTIVSLHPDQHLVELLNFIGDSTLFAAFRNNRYIHTARTNGFRRVTKHRPQNSTLVLSFSDWQQLMNEDKQSFSLSPADSVLQRYEPELIINDSRNTVQWKAVEDKHLSIKGQSLPKVSAIPPYSSMVVLRLKTLK